MAPYKWVTGVINLLIGVISTRLYPPCSEYFLILRSRLNILRCDQVWEQMISVTCDLIDVIHLCTEELYENLDCIFKAGV